MCQYCAVFRGVHLKIVIRLQASDKEARTEPVDPFARLLANVRNDAGHGGLRPFEPPHPTPTFAWFDHQRGREAPTFRPGRIPRCCRRFRSSVCGSCSSRPRCRYAVQHGRIEPDGPTFYTFALPGFDETSGIFAVRRQVCYILKQNRPQLTLFSVVWRSKGECW